jgi:hypothetical protein
MDADPMKQIEQKVNVMADRIEYLEKQNQQLVEAVSTGAQSGVQYIAQVINGNNNNIHINNYNEPNVEGLKIELKDLRKKNTIVMVILGKICERLENRGIKMFGRRDKRFEVCIDGKMKGIDPENLRMDLQNMAHKNSDLINGENGPFQGKENNYRLLPAPIQERILDYNNGGNEAKLPRKDMIDTLQN